MTVWYDSTSCCELRSKQELCWRSENKACFVLCILNTSHIINLKATGEVHLITGHKNKKAEQWCSFILSLTSALNGGGC
jgi:hypothetical protein